MRNSSSKRMPLTPISGFDVSSISSMDTTDDNYDTNCSLDQLTVFYSLTISLMKLKKKIGTYHRSLNSWTFDKTTKIFVRTEFTF